MKKRSLRYPFRKVSQDLRKSKKLPESLSTDKWSSEIPWVLCQQDNIILSLCLTQQRKWLESVLDCSRTLSKTEETYTVIIVSLAMQLLANEVDNCETASIARSIVYAEFWKRRVQNCSS